MHTKTVAEVEVMNGFNLYVFIGIPIGKKNVVIYVEEELVEEAKELGFNMSKLCENCLKEAIRRMT